MRLASSIDDLLNSDGLSFSTKMSPLLSFRAWLIAKQKERIYIFLINLYFIILRLLEHLIFKCADSVCCCTESAGPEHVDGLLKLSPDLVGLDP